MDIETLQGGAQGQPTHLSRPGQSVITTATRNRFDAAAHAIWPLLVARLRRAGASPEDAEDVAQEALLRAWDRNIHFADDGDLLRWCTVVARRTHIDRIRQQSRLLDLADHASDSACRDLEAVEFRHVLGTVNTALAQLTEQERASLAPAPAKPHGDRATQVRTAVARHRARYRLRLLVGPFGALVAQILRTLRRGVPAAVTAGALAAAALTVTLGGLDRGHPYLPAPPRGGPGSPGAAIAPPAGRHVAPPMRLVAAKHPLRTASTDPPPVVRVQGPEQTGVGAKTRPTKPDDHLVCVDDQIVGIGRYCVGHPVSRVPAAQPGS
jgi:RNA polymerase sigma factor (sigma-70 family)